jgi:ABC-type Fe3+ transport system substrate-binding protein
VEKAARKVIGFLPANHPLGLLRMDADSIGDVKVHRYPLGEMLPPPARKLLGTGKAVIAFRKDGLLVAFGEDYVRDLLTKQDLVISGDKRQMAEWVVRGRYPIAIGMGSDTMLNYQHEGVGLNVKPLPGTENVAFDTVAVINRPPHPNAQRLFVNWMLTQRVPTLLSQAVTQNSLRTDVPPVAPDEALDPSRLDSYLVTPREEFAPVRQHTLQITSELLK